MRWRHMPSAHGYAVEDVAEKRIAFTSSTEKFGAKSASAGVILRTPLICVLPLSPISRVRAFSPGLRTPFHVQQGNNQHAISANLVQHSVGEAPYKHRRVL